MKDIRLQYQTDTGIRVDPEMNLIEDYEENEYKHPFPYLYDYINWLEDQLDNRINESAVKDFLRIFIKNGA